MELARPIPKAKSRLTTAYAGWLQLFNYKRGIKRIIKIVT
jgi:hypothetical protein